MIDGFEQGGSRTSTIYESSVDSLRKTLTYI